MTYELSVICDLPKSFSFTYGKLYKVINVNIEKGAFYIIDDFGRTNYLYISMVLGRMDFHLATKEEIDKWIETQKPVSKYKVGDLFKRLISTDKFWIQGNIYEIKGFTSEGWAKMTTRVPNNTMDLDVSEKYWELIPAENKSKYEIDGWMKRIGCDRIYFTHDKIYPIKEISKNIPYVVYIEDDYGMSQSVWEGEGEWEYIPPSKISKSDADSNLIKNLFIDIKAEYDNSIAKHGIFNSTHEGWAVIKEELEELWEDVKKDDFNHAEKEALQIAAMALKFLAMINTKIK